MEAVMRMIAVWAFLLSASLAAYGVVQEHGVPGSQYFTSAPMPAAPAPASSAKAAMGAGRTIVSTVVNESEPAPTPQAVAQAAGAPAPAAPAAAASRPSSTALPPVQMAETTPAAGTPRATASQPAATPTVPPPQRTSSPACANSNALGVTRVVEIDTTGGPGFGFEHFKQHDFLRNNEVVLTFDDGPWLNSTPAVLKALADECVRATFFPIGKHATYYPEILKQVAAAGHSIGNHTWSHQDLSRKQFADIEKAKAEIEMGISAVRMAAGVPTAPFFRFPALRHPPEMVKYLGERNIAIFSTDMDSFDFKIRKAEQVVSAVMNKLKKHGKGIVLMHDFQLHTAEALPELLSQLKANGYKVVHMRAKAPITTIAQYDEMLVKEQKLPTVSTRPTSSVVRDVNE
jgi:peptidoglycan/xylan/chitin deacetylase (PgdA/CDA1 family)